MHLLYKQLGIRGLASDTASTQESTETGKRHLTTVKSVWSQDLEGHISNMKAKGCATQSPPILKSSHNYQNLEYLV